MAGKFSIGGNILRNLRHILGAKFKKGGRKSWQKHFEKKVLPEYAKILESNAKAYANEGGKSGTMADGVYIGRGGRGRGNPSVSIHVKGPAAEYARIVNFGGVIRAKNVKNLTIPLDLWVNPFGQKKQALKDIPDHRTFLLKRGGAKYVMYKEGGTLITSKKGNQYIKKGTESMIYPIFLLKKAHTIKGNHWADRAYDKSRKNFRSIVSKAFDEWSRDLGTS